MFLEKQKSILQEIKTKLFTQIRTIEKKIQTISKECEFQEKELEDKFVAKLNKLREDSTRKITFGVGLHQELRRKYD